VSARRNIYFLGWTVRRGDHGVVVRYDGDHVSVLTIRWATGREGVCLADDVARRRKQGGDGVAA
jgi:hypothetical protein